MINNKGSKTITVSKIEDCPFREYSAYYDSHHPGSGSWLSEYYCKFIGHGECSSRADRDDCPLRIFKTLYVTWDVESI